VEFTRQYMGSVSGVGSFPYRGGIFGQAEGTVGNRSCYTKGMKF